MPKFQPSDDYDVFQFIKDAVPNVESKLINQQVVDDLKN